MIWSYDYFLSNCLDPYFHALQYLHITYVICIQIPFFLFVYTFMGFVVSFSQPMGASCITLVINSPQTNFIRILGVGRPRS